MRRTRGAGVDIGPGGRVRATNAYYPGVESAAGSAADPRVASVERGLLRTPLLATQPHERVGLAERMEQLRVPGVSGAVIADFQIQWARGYGRKEAGDETAVTPDTLFLAGSISKPVTAVAALRLVEQGRLDLDADVNDALRSWQVPPNDRWQPRVTLRHLLSHSGGLTVHGFPGYPRDEALPSLVQILDGAAPSNTPSIRVDTLPGAQPRYSGGGYCIAQQLLVDVTGIPFPQLMRELVLGPLGMTRSTYENPLPEARWDEAATGHRAGGRPVYGKWHVYPEMAAAGLWTTPTDLCRFVIALQRALAGDDSTFLSRQLAQQTVTPHGEPRTGLGLFLDKQAGMFEHGGQDEGFVCHLRAYEEGGRGAVVMTNSDRPGTLIPEILRGIGSAYGWPNAVPKQRIPAAGVTGDANTAAAYVGEYELRPDYRLRVTHEHGGLFLSAPGQPAMEVLPDAEADDTYFLRAANADVRFVRAPDGQVTGLTFRQNGRPMPAKKLDGEPRAR